MNKSNHQVWCEENVPQLGYIHKRRITKESDSSLCKIGEVVTVKQYGTFGCWDEQNRWVDFYNTEPA